MKRREFITLLGGAAAAWPLAARAQGERTRRIGVLMNLTADDPESPARLAAFAQGLADLGWTIGRNLRIDYRWAAGDPERIRRDADELVALAPDLILSSGTPTVAALHKATRSVPIVFAQVVDPVGNGFVETLARPGGNITGFSVFEYGISGKWLELLKEIAPSVTRAAILRDLALASGSGQFGALQSVAPSLGVELSPVDVGDAGAMERAVVAFARSPNGGLIVTASTLAVIHRELITRLAAEHRLPAVYHSSYYITSGGLISYGPNSIDPFRRAASYVDRILKGEKPGELPVQAPTKYDLVINLKTAKALGLEVPDNAARARRRGDRMKRREFITLLGGAAVAWPLAARRSSRQVPQDSERTVTHHPQSHRGGQFEQENGHGALHGPVRVHTRSVDGIYEAPRGPDGCRQGAGTEARMPV